MKNGVLMYGNAYCGKKHWMENKKIREKIHNMLTLLYPTDGCGNNGKKTYKFRKK